MKKRVMKEVVLEFLQDSADTETVLGALKLYIFLLQKSFVHVWENYKNWLTINNVTATIKRV